MQKYLHIDYEIDKNVSIYQSFIISEQPCNHTETRTILKWVLPFCCWRYRWMRVFKCSLVFTVFCMWSIRLIYVWIASTCAFGSSHHYWYFLEFSFKHVPKGLALPAEFWFLPMFLLHPPKLTVLGSFKALYFVKPLWNKQLRQVLLREPWNSV